MFKKILSSELGKGTLILFIMLGIFNLLNFAFHFTMARILEPAEYGTLAVLISITYIYGVPTEAIQNIISKYTIKFNIKRQYGKIKFLMFKSLKKGFKISFFIFVVLFFLAFGISYILNINFWLIFLANFIIFGAFLTPIVLGVLQGRKKFFSLGGAMVFEASFKMIFSVSLVIFGFGVYMLFYGFGRLSFNILPLTSFSNRPVIITTF